MSQTAPSANTPPGAPGGSSRENNFGMVRLLAALMVIVGHNAFISDSTLPLFFQQGIQVIGIQTLFVVGGYMIATSWLHDPHPLRYGVKRVMRIFPPLIVLCLLMVFILGPVMTTLPLNEYFKNPVTYQYFYNIWMNIRYNLPGVFAENPYANVVNGSLWSLPLELFNYLMVPLLLWLARVKKDSGKGPQLLFLAFCFVLWAAQVARLIWFPGIDIPFYSINVREILLLCPYYFFGAALALPLFRKYLDLQAGVILMLLYACFSYNLPHAVSIGIFMIFWPYTVLSIGAATPPRFAGATKGREISYGLYLYGFPVQQTLVDLTIRAGLPIHPLAQVVVATAITAVLAYGSYRLVERPCQNLTKKLTAKIKG